jgi:hypothetical protein
MPDTLADLPLARHAKVHAPGTQGTDVRKPDRAVTDWWIIGLFWLASLGCIWFAAENFRAVALAADQVEAAFREAPTNQVGRGACAAFAVTQPPVMFDPDSECWINLTQKQYRDGTVRARQFPFDNAPYGRELHWSSSFSWWLLLLAGVAHAFSGMPMETAIAQVAPWANPVLFACFVSALALVLWRRVGAWPTGMLILTLTTLTGVEWDFSSGHPDHHGLHLMAFTGLFLGALLGRLGWVRAAPDGEEMPGPAPDFRRARFWFTASGVFGGIGLWIGSAQQITCIGVLGAGAVLGAWCFAGRRATGAASRFEPDLWRHWSRVGAVTSLFFYAVEYFPAHLEMRTEVNSPLVALGWAGAGELMWLLTMAKIDWAGLRVRRGAMLGRLAVALAAVAALPLAIILGPRQWFVLGNPIIRWSATVISEGRPWLDPHHPVAALAEIWNYTGVLMLALPVAVGVLIWRRQAPWRRAALLTLLLTAAMFLGWTLLQNRWMGFLEISLLLLTLAAVFCLPGSGRQGAVRPALLAAFLLPGWLGFGVLQVRTRLESPLLHARALLEGVMSTKEAAWNLELYSAQASHQPARVMAPPGPSPTLHYYGGVDTVGSYYWENLSGCQDAIDFYNDTGDDTQARRIVRERGLDFVMAVAQPSFVLEMQLLKNGKVNVAAARKMLAFKLSSPSPAGVPAWLERLPLLDAPLATAGGIRIYRVRRDRL